MFNQLQFIADCKKAVCDWLVEHYGEYAMRGFNMNNEIYVVWQCKTLQNSKAILCALTPDKFLFECTLNGDKQELYLDVYDKIQNKCIK